jgi:hypothetical protein
VWQNGLITAARNAQERECSIRDRFNVAKFWLDLAIGAFGAVSGLIGWWLLAARKRRAESWPMVPGRVERAVVEGTDTGYFADISYSYQANGEFFSGFYQKSFRMRRFAEEFADMTRGQNLFVRYDPEKPKVSVIRDQDNAALLVLK